MFARSSSTGAGGNFCAGADISEFSKVRFDAESGRIYEEAGEAATLAIRDCRKPTIAAISGYAIGGGCGLALACDFRIADRSARMGITAARLGIVYGTLDCELLYRQVGLANAKRVLFSGQHFAIDDCVAMGLVDMVATEARARSRSGLRGGDRRQCATLGRRLQADPRGDCRGYGRSTQEGDRRGHRSRDDKRGLSRGRASVR